MLCRGKEQGQRQDDRAFCSYLRGGYGHGKGKTQHCDFNRGRSHRRWGLECQNLSPHSYPKTPAEKGAERSCNLKPSLISLYLGSMGFCFSGPSPSFPSPLLLPPHYFSTLAIFFLIRVQNHVPHPPVMIGLHRRGPHPAVWEPEVNYSSR